MIRIDVSVELGKAKLEKLIEVFSKGTLITLIEKRILGWMDENFAKAGIEHKWPALAPSTVMLQRGPNGKSRQRTRPLESWRQKVHSRVTGNEVWVGFAPEIQKMTPWHHFGTDPYEIFPRNKRVLAAALPSGLRASILGPTGSVGGTDYLIFGKYVRHPGLPARPLIPSQTLARQMVLETLNGALEQAVKDAENAGR